MKKYLMTGVAALAICAAFTSCSKGEELYDQGAIDKQKEMTVNERYIAAFEKAFGKVGANVDWGFSSKAKTRTVVNVNGNLWEEIPNVSPAEKKKVFDYVNMTKPEMKANGHKYTEKFPENIPNYWVSQVWTGTDTYPNYDGATGMGGSPKMNNLHIADNANATITNGDLSQTGWYHVNNFNRGDNTDWSGNTLIYDSGTFDFAYLGAEDSNYHNRWIAVKGEDIDASLAGYYYICFDHIAIPDGCETIFELKSLNGGKVHVPGAFDSVEALLASGLVDVNEEGQKTITVKEHVYWPVEEIQDVTYVIDADDWTWTQVVSGNEFIDANDVYTDWIIRLVAATPGEEIPETHLYRVIAEDLTADDASDFDFNDVIFDVVEYNAATDKTTLKLIACGGTLHLTVGGVEVHSVYGQNAPNADGKYTMFNTGGATHAVTNFEVDGKYTEPGELLNLQIVVTKEGVPMTLTATKGVAACKILVDDRFPIVPERTSIADKLGNFTTYVQGNWKANDDFWWVQTGN